MTVVLTPAQVAAVKHNGDDQKALDGIYVHANS